MLLLHVVTHCLLNDSFLFGTQSLQLKMAPNQTQIQRSSVFVGGKNRTNMDTEHPKVLIVGRKMDYVLLERRRERQAMCHHTHTHRLGEGLRR